MAFRQAGASRRRVASKIYQTLGEHSVVPNPLWNTFSQSKSSYADGHSFIRRHYSASEYFLHRRDSEDGSTQPRSLEERKEFSYKSFTGTGVPHSRIWPEFATAPGLKQARGVSFDPLRSRLFSSQTRVLYGPSTSSASAAAPTSYQEDEDAQKTKKAEPSAEECDQAVVGLSSAKAKVKQNQDVAKKSDASQSQGLVKKFWSVILGIVPAIRAILAMSREDWSKKISGWKKHIWQELQHYWLGTKLLWADTRISSRLLLKLAGGKSLTRRERQQLTRTAADIFRLVPFAVFVIVPFMEFLLPVALKLFPNMLPSTFQDKMKEQEQLKKRLNARIQYAKFLQDTVGEMARELKSTRSGELQRTANDLDEFMNKVRTGGDVTNDEILNFAKLFNDELTLDNISRPRLVSMCKYMGIQPYGTDAYLRYSLRTKLNWIKTDDRMIQSEGVESLSESELRAACRERGMLGLLSVDEMRQQLNDWLDLSLQKSVPSSLLILSRAFMVSGRIRPEEAMQATLSSLPDEVVDSIGTVSAAGEDALAERKRKLEFLKEQEALIKEEAAKEMEEQERAKIEQERQKAEEKIKLVEEDISFHQENVANAQEGQQMAQQMAESKSIDKKEELCKISSALAVLASASSVSKERGEFLRLVNREIQLYNNMVAKEGTPEEEEARKAYRAAREDSDHAAEVASESRVSSALIERVDAMLHKLEKELDDVDEKIGDRWRILDRDYDGKVTAEEVAAAAMYLKDTLGQENLQELISKLAKDEDGKILVEDIVKLGSSADVEEEHQSEGHGDDGREQQKQPVSL
ncbi:LETM1 and EF-hand domain-containing protein 1, mitochondrial [Marchantia polymorpha subsp. ruderalis]|uniref:Mitochondrial proton/calcium exchanger protein n=2 Tax=Marchantia polymorpha TaxID=3197 RepID=A0AAF6BG25_MARPO|nr:hypothetical protein MARPO_0198s0012 [Marchantia polymorpha]BBN10959.1 hypothetical protein Mp_5g07930 [Marchantia polymorpha subsp. ruderalis]|eukprot:PTQ27444.1 hypothetical protein MARPO_0198s0012 [Marchantia polymorpha]